MEFISRSFRLEGGSSSFRLGRSTSSLLISESISSECAKVVGYERLSESMRMSNEYRRRKSRGLGIGFMSRIFSFRKAAIEKADQARTMENQEEKKKKKRSSWLPDPERRWPVQGW